MTTRIHYSLEQAELARHDVESRTERIIRTGHMTAVDAILLGIASWVGGIPDGGDAQDLGVNAPLYQDEPSTWCGRCKAQYWSARCPSCGK